MQQHSVPQNITAFEFKLVGFLTLKQFLYLAAVGIISFLVFVSTANFLKWFFIAPLVLIGLAFAFFPINGMAFDKWIVVFIKAVTSPSRRIWRKEPKVLSFLEPKFSYYLRRPTVGTKIETGGRNKLDAYLSQIKKGGQPSKLDNLERTRLAMLDFSRAEPTLEKPDVTIAEANEIFTLAEFKKEAR